MTGRPDPTRAWPLDLGDKALLITTDRAFGTSNAPIWEYVYEGSLTRDALLEALRRHIVAFPYTLAHVVPVDADALRARRFEFRVPDGADVDALVEFQTTDRLDPAVVLTTGNALRDGHIDVFRAPPFRIVVLQADDQRGVLWIQYHHSIGDGRAFFDWTAALWERLAEVRRGDAPPPAANVEVPRRPETDVVDGRWRRILWALLGFLAFVRGAIREAMRPLTPILPNLSVDYRGPNRCVHIQYPDAILEGWNRARRAAGASLNAWLCATLLDALRTWSNEVGTPTGRTRLMLLVETRPRGGSFRSMANHLATWSIEVDLSRPQAFDQLVSQIHAQSRAQADRQTHLRAMLFNRWAVLRTPLDALRRALLPPATTTVTTSFSNVLPIPCPLARLPGFRMTRVLLTTPAAPRAALFFSALHAGDAVTLNVNYKASIVSRAQAERFAQLWQAALESAMTSAPDGDAATSPPADSATDVARVISRP